MKNSNGNSKNDSNEMSNKYDYEEAKRKYSDFYHSCKFYNKFVGSVEIAKRT